MKTVVPSLIAVLALFGSFDSHSQEIKVRPADFNSEFMDFAPTYFRDGLVFCTNRTQKLYEDDIDSLGYFYTDLFFVQIDDNGRSKSAANLLSKDLTTFLNEGPAVFTTSYDRIYYTTSIEPDKKEKRKRIREYRLGIYTAQYDGNRFVKIESLPFNTTTNKFNCMHPAISPDNRMLVFASNMEQKNNPDLYYCLWENGQWSEPKNMGSVINSPKVEVFPTFGRNGRLYFSSNRGRDKKDFDIFYSDFENESWTKPEPMPAPINSKADDYGYTEHPSGTKGFFSSNRGSEMDNIFYFEHQFPSMTDCRRNSRPTYCYLIEDEEIMKLDSLPLVYEWDLGDGTRKQGISVKHCFADTGTYVVSLNIMDTTTKQMFINVSQTELRINKSMRPFMHIPDTVLIGQEVKLHGEKSEAFFGSPWHYWAMEDGSKYVGNNHIHFFEKSGKFQAMLGVTYQDSVSATFGGCSFKPIVVYRTESEWETGRAARKSELMALKEAQALQMKDKRVPIFKTLDAKMELTYEEVSARYLFDVEGQALVEDLNLYAADLRKPKSVLAEDEIAESEYDLPDESSSVVLLHKLDVTDEVLRAYFENRKKHMDSQPPTPIGTKVKTEEEKLADLVKQQEAVKTSADKEKTKELPGTVNAIEEESEFVTPASRMLSLSLELNEMLMDKEVNFSPGSTELTAEAKERLKYLAVVLDIEPEARLRMGVSLPIGKARKEAFELSERRFEIMRDYMVGLGVEESRLEWGVIDATMRSGLLGTEGHGEIDSHQFQFRLKL